MIVLETNIEPFANDLCEVVRLFYPGEEIVVNAGHDGAHMLLRSTTAAREGQLSSAAVVIRGGQSVCDYEYKSAFAPGDALEEKRLRKHAAKIALFRALVQMVDAPTPWGSLTGIRPTKFARELARRNGEEEMARTLREEYDVSPDKLALVQRILRVQQPLLQGVSEDDYDAYIGIPFCRTRCTYCSFASQQYNKTELVEPYLAALKQEIERSAQLMRARGLRLRCLYVGGGTPTALSCDQLETVLETALGALGEPLEFTVEAGRPDTIDDEKLRMLKAVGAERISINPQSMNERTLQVIGRSHAPRDIESSFALARRHGFKSINMDVIAGLPGEDAGLFASTLGAVQKMAPDNLTVHTLAVKRASLLKERLEQTPLPGGDETTRMLALAAQSAQEMDMRPYYLYRQKYMSGNLENTGYAARGKECLYNIDIMEEQVSILAMGSGAISKWIAGSRLERAPNPKDLPTYIGGIDGIISDKEKMIDTLRNARGESEIEQD